MKEGLALLEKNLPAEDRRIAEMCYHLGMAHSLNEVGPLFFYGKPGVFVICGTFNLSEFRRSHKSLP